MNMGCSDNFGAPHLQKMKSSPGLFKRQIFQSALGILFVVTAWVICIPAQFGGNLNYVVITGNSMEPLFHAGDLVVTNNDPNYAVGDIVVYTHPEVGKIIHRIIRREGERFVLQGDNNTWVDAYQPVREEIIGKYWFSIPKVGTIFLKLRQPWLFTLFSGASAMILGVSMVKTPQKEKKQKIKKIGFLHHFGTKIGQWKDGYWFPVYLLGLGSLILGIFSFIKPLQTNIDNEILYSQSGEFAYSGIATQDIYDSNIIQSGDPIFTSLACSANFSFDYLVSADHPIIGLGDYQLTMALTAPNGWTHTIDHSSLTKFEGNTFHAEKALDLCEIQQYLKFVGATTGIERQPYTLEIRPVVNYSGMLDGSLFETQFSPVLQFRVEDEQVFLVKDSASEEDPLLPVAEGVITVGRVVPNSMNILGLKLPVRTGRVISVFAFLLAAAGIALPCVCLRKAEKDDTRLKDRMLFGQMLVEIHQSPAGAQDQVIDLSSLEDLLSLAEKTGSTVMALYSLETTEYFVQIGNKYFKFSKSTPHLSER